MKYNAVIFDLFGTLVDDFDLEDHQRVMTQMAERLGIPFQDFTHQWVYETYPMRATGSFATIEANLEHICQALGVHVEDRRIKEAADFRIACMRRTLTPRRDAIETLTHLKMAGYKIVLISDCAPDVPLLWPETPFVPFIQAPVFSCVARLKKPDPKIYQLACEQLEVSPQQCVYVGDGNSRELSGATQLGMKAVLIFVPGTASHDSPGSEANTWQGASVSSLHETLALLEGRIRYSG